MPNTLDKTHPLLAAQWHPTKNGDLKPSDVLSGSHNDMWWLCPKKCPEGCPHEWSASIERRANRGDGCPNCSRKGKKDSYCQHMYLSYTHPEIAEQWHPTKNGDLKPSLIMAGTEQPVWWLCPQKCPEGCPHEWFAPVKSRTTAGADCGVCSKKKFCIHMSLLYTHPELAAQWHPTKNGDLKPSDVLAGSHDSVWWLCPKKCPEGCPHEWAAVIKSRVGMNAGCAVCDRKKICIHTSLLYTHPELAAQWHPTKNGKIKPSDVSAGSSYKAWWVCPIKTKKNSIHEWRAAIPNRTGQGQGCNICKHKTEKILYDFLIKLFPTLVKNKLLDNCKKIRCLPFDFEIPEKKTIIELDGAHHFKQVSNWKSNLITVKEDVFKMQKATERDYKIIRISQQDVFDNNVAWLEEHLLSEINSNDRNHMFISTIENLYDEHIRLYNRHIKIILDDITEPTPAPTAV